MKKILILILALAPGAFALKVGDPAPEFVPTGDWIYSAPLKVSALKGKVVLVNMWTFGCINCHNSLPTLRGFYKEFKAKGFEIVGVHAPEFDYEKDLANVKKSMLEDGVEWPVFQDNAMKTWRAYGNRFWPTFYLMDRTGKIRYIHQGEISTRYPAGIKPLERLITTLLEE